MLFEISSINMLTNAASENGDGGILQLARVKLAELLPEDGAASGVYTRAVEKLSLSLARNNAAVIELNGEDAALLRCALDSAKLYFRSRLSTSSWNTLDWVKHSGYLAAPTKEMYFYRSGRSPKCAAMEPPPPCLPEVFRCLGKTSRASLSAIAHYLRLRGDAFGQLLDDLPLLKGEISSSVLTATAFHAAGSGGKAVVGDFGTPEEVEKGLLLLIASDTPGLQVMDPNGCWYLADNAMGPGDLLLLTGRTLEKATAGVRKAAVFRVVPVSATATASFAGRTSLAFRLMPRMNATIDCKAVAQAGHPFKGYGPVLVQTFLDALAAAELAHGSYSKIEAGITNEEPALRSSLLDSPTGAFLEDAMASRCGHSYGGGTLQRVNATMLCATCEAGVTGNSLIPNLALRAAAAAFKREEQKKEEQKRQVDFGSLRGAKRKRESEELVELTRLRKLDKESPPLPEKDSSQSKSQVVHPFTVDEKVLIKGNKRTPEKLVGREASIISQCLNGWYLVRLLDNGENVRLQYRSLARTVGEQQTVNGEPCVIATEENLSGCCM